MRTEYKIKIPEKYFIGLQYSSFRHNYHHNAPRAFITPWGDDSVSKKRIKTAERYASSNSKRDTQLSSKIIENKPASGFRIVGLANSSTTNDIWQIFDPRGYIVSVPSNNILELISSTIIEEQEILDPCIWSRIGGDNYLISINSEKYQQAISNTNRIIKKVSLKDVNIGNEILLTSGQKGIYLGKFFDVSFKITEYTRNMEYSSVVISENKKYYVLIDNERIVKNKNYKAGLSIPRTITKKEKIIKSISSLKISEILDSSKTLTIEESEELINKMIVNLDSMVYDGNSYRNYNIIGVCSSKITNNDVNIELKNDNLINLINEKQNKSKQNDLYYNIKRLILCYNNDWYLINFKHFTTANCRISYYIDKNKLLSSEKILKMDCQVTNLIFDAGSPELYYITFSFMNPRTKKVYEIPYI